jgi:hypothetical protein
VLARPLDGDICGVMNDDRLAKQVVAEQPDAAVDPV